MTYKPSQLQRQVEEIERIEKAIADAKAPPAAPDPETPPETPAEPVGQAPSEPTPVPPTPPAPPTDDQWRHRYLTLEGKYKAEVPRLHQQVKDLSAQLAEAIAKIETVTTRTPEPPKARTPLVTDKDAETYGSDLLDLIKRQAQEMFADREAELLKTIDRVVADNEALKQKFATVTKSQEATGQQVYLSKLTQLVPDWETINADPAFLTWLGEVEGLSGMPRQAFLDDAFSAADANRTAAIFNAFKSTRPAAPVPPRSDVQRQVTPGKSKSVPATPANDTRQWTHSEIDQFYTDVRSGKYRGKVEEAARIEAEIDLAVAQGRVRA